MRQRQYGGPQLPKELRDRFGDPAHQGKSIRGRSGQQMNRKERRKAERDVKKAQKRQSGKPTRRANGPSVQASGEDDEDDWSEEDTSQLEKIPPPRNAQKPVKSILKSNTKSESHRSQSPPPRPSRAVKDRLAQDDAEIAALEKKLGIRGKKKSKGGDDYGLSDIFGDLGGSGSDEDVLGIGTQKRKRDKDDEWLASKRRKALGSTIEEEEDEEGLDSSLNDFDTDDLNSDASLTEDEGSASDDNTHRDIETEESGFEGFDSEDDKPDPKPRTRENPYIAPVTSDAPQPQKYVPPALRAPATSDVEALARLKRQIQGLLNRLSDANMLTILRDVEQIYQNNPRGYVTTTLIDLLIGMLSDETTLIDTFIILHAGFIAAIYRAIGPDFGAQLVERIVSEIDRHYQGNKNGAGKQTANLISTVAQLYSFQVIGCNLVFDYIRQFLDELSEINTELLLRIIRLSGSQLRHDDPTSLKDIVMLLQKSVVKVGQKNLPVRTKFMIETINDLKNNRMKTGVAASAITSEHVIRMKKQLGTMSGRNLKGTEPLRIGLLDIRDTEKKGKWWQVGASWRNEAADETLAQKKGQDREDLDVHHGQEDNGEVDLFQLAREQRMNTDVRRAIFVTIMSATDYKEAHMRLLKLNLKKAQETEIPRVIVHCAGCEEAYNPYYTVLARKFCADHKSRKCFQFALWDVFKSLGERKDDEGMSDDEDEGDSKEDVSLRKLVNLGKLYGTLMAKGDLSITCLKPLNFPYLKSKTKMLIEILLVTTMLESQKGPKQKLGRGKHDEKALLNIFINVDGATEMVAGLQYFMKRVVARTEITANKTEKETVRWACKVVMDMLERLMAATTMDEA